MQNTYIASKLSDDELDSIIRKFTDFCVKNNIRSKWCNEVKDSEIYLHTPTQVYMTRSGKIRFTMWNMLGTFTGHYDVVLNPDTFEYKMKQIAAYGNLVSTMPAFDDVVYTKQNMTDEQRLEVEATCAAVLKRTKEGVDAFEYISVVSLRTQMFINMIASDDINLQCE